MAARLLGVAGAVAVVLVAALLFLGNVLGRWAAQRTLLPLHALVEAAHDVAHGSLDTRVDARSDPDLLPLAEAFNTTTTALWARVERDARFASDVSQELRSPLTTMVNAAELLQNRRHELSDAGQEALDLMRGEVRHFRLLVEDLLEVSRDDQLPDLQREPVRVAAFVRRVADRRAGGPVTRTSPEVEDLVVAADPRRLERIVGNLVDNARLHGQGVREVTVERAGAHVRITVSDCGQGISEDERERVFERFFRGSSSRAGVPGSGLGLAIVAQHVRPRRTGRGAGRRPARRSLRRGTASQPGGLIGRPQPGSLRRRRLDPARDGLRGRGAANTRACPPGRLPAASPSLSAPTAVARGRVWGARDGRLVPVFTELEGTGTAARVRAVLSLADPTRSSLQHYPQGLGCCRSPAQGTRSC